MMRMNSRFRRKRVLHSERARRAPLLFLVLASCLHVVAATLSCQVHNLGKYKVIWFHVDRQMLLTIHNVVVTRIPRFSLDHTDEEVWTLKIGNVQRDDKGQYMCQINTDPILNQTGFLDVIVPPKIVDMRSSPSSVAVHEFGNKTLSCHAEGNPTPKISWMREDGKPITVSKRNKSYTYEGADLTLEDVTRTDMGAYLCIASNKVPPSVSKRIELFVKFSPSMLVPEQLISIPRSKNASLICETEAFPKAVTFWRFKEGIIMSTQKYHLTEEVSGYRSSFRLHISNVTENDYGKYQCISRNSFGENTGTVSLNELVLPETIQDAIKEKQDEDGASSDSDQDYLDPRDFGHSQIISDTDNRRFLSNTKDSGKRPKDSSYRRKTQMKQDPTSNIFSTIFSGETSNAAKLACPHGIAIFTLLCVCSLR